MACLADFVKFFKIRVALRIALIKMRAETGSFALFHIQSPHRVQPEKMEDILPTQILLNLQPLLASGGLAPDQIPGLGWLTNSIFVAVLVLLVVLLFCRMATKKMELVPGRKQNFVEFVIEFLYNQVEAIVGPKVAPRAFPLLATIFIFVLVSNYSGLIPGVGTIGFGPTKDAILTLDMERVHAAAGHDSSHAEDDAHSDKPADAHKAHGSHPAGEELSFADKVGDHFYPILRPPTADLNFTLSLALLFMAVWAYLTIKEVGVWGFIVHTFGVKGGMEGFMKYALMPIFFFVGLIEIISILARPVSLSLRLFGNVYAGETLLHTMSELGKSFGLGGIWAFLTSVAFPIPFYFMEILVGVLQATVFALLCAVYIKLSTAHEEEHDH